MQAELPSLRLAGNNNEARVLASAIAATNAGASSVVQVYVFDTVPLSQPATPDTVVVTDVWVVFGPAALAEWASKSEDQQTAFVANLTYSVSRYHPQSSVATIFSSGSLRVLAAGTYLRNSDQRAVHFYD